MDRSRAARGRDPGDPHCSRPPHRTVWTDPLGLGPCTTAATTERSIQRYAAAAFAREADWVTPYTRLGPGDELQKVCHGQRSEYIDAEGEPLSLLLEADGTVLRATDGTCFAVIGGPSSRRRGRSKATTGESPWQFRQSHTVGAYGGMALPDWWLC